MSELVKRLEYAAHEADLSCDFSTLGKLHRETADRITALEAEVERLRQLSNSDLSSDDLKAAERHCDWQQFKHAWNAVFNLRNAAKATEKS
jgi:hypothetical protein